MKVIRSAALWGGMVLTLAACSEQASQPSNSLDGSAESTTLEAAVADVAAEQAGATIQAMNGEGVPRGLLPRLPRNLPGGCDYDAASGRFVCDPVVRPNGPTVNRSYAFLDAGGAGQSAYDDQLTAAINYRVSVAGDFVRGPNSGHIEHQHDLTAGGLLGNESTWTWNGAGSGQEHRVELMRRRPPHRGGPATASGDSGNAPVSVTLDITTSSQVSDVVIPWPPVRGTRPLSGSITQYHRVAITGGPHDGEVRENTVVITFDGTQYATVTVGDETRTIDLADPPAPPHFKRND